MAHSAPYRQYGGPQPYQDQYGPPRGPPRGPPNRQGPVPRDYGGYNDGYRNDGFDDRNYPPPQPPPQHRYPPRGGGPPPQMRRPPQNGPPRDEFYDRRGPPYSQDGPRAPVNYPQNQQGPPRRQRPPIQALDLAGSTLDPPPRRRPDAEEYVALVSPIYDKKFELDDRPQITSPNRNLPPSLRNGHQEPMPTMQFNMGGPPPRTKSAPPDDPRNWDRNGPPMPRPSRDPYDDRRGPPHHGMPNTIGRGPPRNGRPPPQQLYDRGPEPRRRSPPQQYDGRGPPPRSNTLPVMNGDFDPRGPPPRGYDRGPPNRGMNQNGYPDPRQNPRNENVDDMLDTYLEELGSPPQQITVPPSRPDPRIDPRDDPRYNNRPPPRTERRTPSISDNREPDQYVPPDRRQLASQVAPQPTPGILPRSQTAPGINTLDRGVQQMDLRRQSPPNEPRTHSPNKLQKSPPKQTVPAGVQSQTVTMANGNQIDPNALPVFPSPKNPPNENSRQNGPSPQDRGSFSSEGSYRARMPIPEKPKLTFALLEEYRRDAKEAPHDPAIQLDLAKALLEASVVLSQEQGMGDPKRVAKSRENYIAEAHKIVKKLASSGATGVGRAPYPEAVFFLASCYGEGLMGLQVDLDKAFGLYFQAAKAGHTASCYRTALSCEVGIGTKRDPQKALQFYRRAASSGDVPSMYKLGVIMLRGLLGLPVNTREGITWLQRAAENADEENPQALFVLAQLYESPDDAVNGTIIQDEAYALELYVKGAHLGHSSSQFKLGVCYEYGNLGCAVDPRKSIAWYSRAAEQGNPEAELALSGWYLTGAEGILPQSDQEAFLWAQKAAEKGSPKAEFAVGYYIETGIGTASNLQEAKRWYLRAAEQGQKRAMARLAELKKMPNGGAGAAVGSSGGRRELQKQRGRGGAGGGKEDCSVM